jgi:hypothetical protein
MTIERTTPNNQYGLTKLLGFVGKARFDGSISLAPASMCYVGEIIYNQRIVLDDKIFELTAVPEFS